MGIYNGKIALMGGTFDPIHYGHLASAETVRAEFGFDKVIFVPSGNPPHKDAKTITSGEMRFHMTKLAVSQNENFGISDIEIVREGPTYTIDTVKEMKRQGNASISFITGADALNEILTWRNAKELLKLCSFIATTRPGYNNQTLLSHTEHLKEKYGAEIYFIEVPALAISSSEIRNRVMAGRPIKYMLPEEVERYIYENRLYGS